MGNLYKEKIENSVEFRQQYLSSINDFLNKENKKAEMDKGKFISPKKIKLHHEKYRKQLIKQLGFSKLNDVEVAKLDKKILIAEEENVSIYKLVFDILDGIKFYGILFLQNDKNSPFVYALHGGGGTPETISDIYDCENYNSFARRIVNKGVSVFCPQLLLWHKENFGGETFDRKIIDGRLKQLGWSITALELYLMIASLNYFEKNNYLNGNVGVAGMSYGGMYAMFLSAIEKRIKSTLSSSFYNDRFEYAWSDWSYLNSARRFSDTEVCALICPKSLCISLGDKDEMFDIDKAKTSIEKLKSYYKYLNCENKFYFYSFDGKHEFDKDNSGIDFFVKELL